MNDEPYSARQSDRDRRYERQYAEYVDSLSPEDRAKLVAKGLEQPHVERRGGGSAEGDLADSPLASEHPDIAGAVDPIEPAPASPLSAEQILDTLRRLLGEVLCQPNRSLAVECLALASGVSFMGDSELEIARRHGVPRSAVSKRCVELTERLGLPPSLAMRRLTARRAYARTQHRIRDSHERLDRGGRKRNDQG